MSKQRFSFTFSCLFAVYLALQITTIHGQRVLDLQKFSIDLKQYPFMVQLRKDIAQVTSCSGVLISLQHVLTAAHCVEENNDWKHITVVAGAKSIEDNNGVKRKISKIFIHPDRDGTLSPVHMDVAILKLNKPFEQGEKIKEHTKLCSAAIKIGDTLQITGWHEPGIEIGLPFVDSKDLQVVRLPIIGIDQCRKKFSNLLSNNANIIKESNGCAYLTNLDSCMTNSGAAGFVGDELCAIGSWNIGCGIDEYPNIFTNIIDAKDFIEKTLKM